MRRALAAVVALTLAASVVTVSQAAPANAATALTNLAHLDSLTTTVSPPAQAGHTTYDLATEPTIGTLWVYANHNDDGTYTPVGGGTFHADSNTYDQGAYDADDIARAAVVYLRHWRQFGDAHSRTMAYEQLRGLTYLQTASGADAGNVVLWMQPDGTLNPSALPKELPDPSDSANSYWLARTIWALGEGYAAFRSVDSVFAKFLKGRMSLALDALRRDSLSHYGDYLTVDGARRPAWLIVDDAGASAEAVLGLSSFVQAGGGFGQGGLKELALGIEAEAGTPGLVFPYGAVLPSATSLSSWHAWASQMPEALARAAVALKDRSLLRPAMADAGSFMPGLIASYGPISGLAPSPTDRSSIAYGVDSRLQSLVALVAATNAPGARQLAGVVAGWYFGENPADTPMYDPATGVTYDGVSADGVVNKNSGAESTIHGLLSMMTLDKLPDVAALAEASGAQPRRNGTTVVEGESAAITGAAKTTVPKTVSSAESTWSGGKYLSITGTATAKWTFAPSPQPRVVEAVVNKVPGNKALGRFNGLDLLPFGGKAQGASPVAGRLDPTYLGTLPANATSITARFSGGSGQLDDLLLTPVISTVRAGSVTLLASRQKPNRYVTVTGPATATSYDNETRVVATYRTSGGHLSVRVPGDGFTVVVAKATSG